MTDQNSASRASGAAGARAGGSLFLLAMDHRASLARTVYGIEGEPGPAQVGLIAAGKRLVFQGLLAAVEAGADPARTGVLVDERYGADVARRAREAGLTLAMPIERSGQDWFTLEYGTLGEDRWLDHVEEFDPRYVKVLVRDNPAFDADRRRAQQDDLAVVTRALHDRGRSLLVELLVPPTDEQKGHDHPGHPDGDYDTEVRPRLTRQVISEMQRAGVEPDIWKVEGLDSAEDAARVVATAQQGGRDAVRCIVLGRDAPPSVLDRWLSVAAGVTGFEGFAIGRSIWEQPLADELAGSVSERGSVHEIADRYLRYVGVYTDHTDHTAHTAHAAHTAHRTE
ncbi:2-deoxy-5-keto-D-gluconate 6-phosphate aldolase domain-containing protein [Streptomyces sp. NBC_01190]|uniref:2-deoxy-5-keto-D-gluconate 6-phosphate aldolase domain-containing protein n=1 Tax=Streptomyces sp. NBC_01190 TaxID=2903767 RepID=UPI003863D0DB|nr:DUF2090 domain-containing protein [Streptomyces sp. NBC_01190]